MKHINFPTVQILFLSLFLTLLASCSPAGSIAPSGEGPDPRLDTRIEAPQQLLMVNNLSVKDVKIPPSVKGITKEEATKILVQAFKSSSEIQVDTSSKFAHELIGEITSYQDRIGSQAGAMQPAQVSLRLQIRERSSGKPIWQGSFSAKDEDISQNLFNAAVQTNSGKGIGFSTGRELLSRGFEEGAIAFSNARLKAFSK